MDFIPRIYRPIINQSQLCTGFTMTQLTNYDSDKKIELFFAKQEFQICYFHSTTDIFSSFVWKSRYFKNKVKFFRFIFT